MNPRKRTVVRSLTTGLLAALPLTSCISTSSGLGQAAQGCPEFKAGATFDSSDGLDVHVRRFMQASADLDGVTGSLRSAVKEACEGMAHDLGVKDTWSSLGDSDDAITNDSGTGSCDQVGARIDAIMTAHVEANFALVVDRGACYPDFTAEAQCEAGCTSAESCTPGSVETRCDPAQLSVQCGGSCEANAFCEGTETTQCNCEGKCEAECMGHCTGHCTDDNGHRTDDDPNCHGKCSDHCSGQCTGRCQVDSSQGIQCGANVYCTGGCTAQESSPRCESDYTPPKCTIDQECFASCRASVAVKAKCDPPTVKLLADVTVNADVKVLVDTINAHLQPLVQCAQTQGHVASDVVPALSSSGQAILNGAGNLDGKSLGCATVASQSLSNDATHLQKLTQAATNVTNHCSSHAD